jgi:hypothetical protein
MRNSYKNLTEKAKGKKPLDKHRCMLEDNIKMHLRDIWYENMD